MHQICCSVLRGAGVWGPGGLTGDVKSEECCVVCFVLTTHHTISAHSVPT